MPFQEAPDLNKSLPIAHTNAFSHTCLRTFGIEKLALPLARLKRRFIILSDFIGVSQLQFKIGEIICRFSLLIKAYMID